MILSQTRDVELIAKLNKHVHDVHVEQYPEYFQEYNYENILAFYQGIINKEEFLFLLLEDFSQPIGYAWVEMKNYPETAFKKEYKSVYVHQISISYNYRNKGYGSILMEEIYSVARSNGINRVELDYWTNNLIAIDFYNKNGFVTYRELVYKEL
ncbi:GNAT family N-acetyltransferase [Bacillus sp. PS06]|uniref:GNAT family N-acetyltransferase n=1 Tax=Bacillus sp. PS06 TaxID=2764176 RepID=UPI00177D59A8|nr:GNAT family N-acetyltransferase [Bacillus sp. PS06]MBD8070660.1 GNAT family N-acetyltransferase [Bacillus sp. PS06]